MKSFTKLTLASLIIAVSTVSSLIGTSCCCPELVIKSEGSRKPQTPPTMLELIDAWQCNPQVQKTAWELFIKYGKAERYENLSRSASWEHAKLNLTDMMSDHVKFAIFQLCPADCDFDYASSCPLLPTSGLINVLQQITTIAKAKPVIIGTREETTSPAMRQILEATGAHVIYYGGNHDYLRYLGSDYPAYPRVYEQWLMLIGIELFKLGFIEFAYRG